MPGRPATTTTAALRPGGQALHLALDVLAPTSRSQAPRRPQPTTTTPPTTLSTSPTTTVRITTTTVPKEVLLSMIFRNLDYNQLVQEEELCAEIKHSVKGAIVSEVGIFGVGK